MRRRVISTIACVGLLGSLAAGSDSAHAGPQPDYTLQAVNPATSLPDRLKTSGVYDTAHHNIVVFGGATGNVPLGDTWTYDGATWTQHSVPGPAARYGAVMAFDSTRNEVVLFGGSTANGIYLGDTWVWNGTAWSQKFPTHSPSSRVYSNMANDPIHHNVVLDGGFNFGNKSDTWLWDGTDWTLANPLHNPGQRTSAIMNFSDALGSVVVWGGTQGIGDTKTWIWDGSDWTALTTIHNPPLTTVNWGSGQLGTTGELVAIGGYDQATQAISPDLRTFSGTDWALRTTSSVPNSGTGALIIWDPILNKALVFAGGDIFGQPVPGFFNLYPTPLTPPVPLPTPVSGYWLSAADGGVFSFGSANYLGNTTAAPKSKPVAGLASTPTGLGYWQVAADGQVTGFGDATTYGDASALVLNKPIVGIAGTPSGHGYILTAADGGIFTYGDAEFHGSSAPIQLNQPITSIAVTPTGHGYWLAAADGGVFTYGDAAFFGANSTLKIANQKTVAIAPTRSGQGYWLVTAAGNIVAYGDATSFGNAAAINLNQPINAIALK